LFAEGIDIGNFILNNRVLSEIVNDPKNVVVNTVIEFSKDGTTWTLLSQLNSNNWQNWNYFANNYKYSQSPQIFKFLSVDANLLRYSGASIRARTIIDKQNCSTLSLNPPAKPLSIAQIQFTKTSITELYSLYPNAFPNYQTRDYFAAQIENIKKSFIETAGNGSQYYYGTGYRDGSQLSIYPRSSTCTGDLNRVLVMSNTSCEIGIYWSWQGVLKLVETVVAVGGLSESEKQLAAIKASLPSIVNAIKSNLDRMYTISLDLSKLESKYSSVEASGVQIAIQEFEKLNSAAFAVWSEVAANRDKLYTILRSKYIDTETRQSIESALKDISKTGSYLSSIEESISENIGRLNNVIASGSTEIKSEVTNSENSISTSKNIQNVVLAWQSKYSNLDYRNMTSEFISEQINYLSKLQSQSAFQLNFLSQKIKIAQVQMNKSAPTTANLWKAIYSNYSNALNIQNQSQEFLNKYINTLKSVTVVSSDTVQLQKEFENAKSALSSASSNYNNVSKISESLITDYKAKNLTNSSQLDNAIMNFKSMSEKMDLTAQEYANYMNKIKSMQNISATPEQNNLISQILAVWNSAINVTMKSQKTYLSMVDAVNNYKKSLGISVPNGEILELEGEDENITGRVSSKKERTSRYLITISTNQPNNEVTVRAVKSKAKAIVFNISTDDEGNVSFRTLRNLAKYKLQLWIDGALISTSPVLN